MLGWINDCVEKLVLDKFGTDAWHTIKEKAGCDVKDGGFLKLEHYPDKSTLDLVKAASAISGLSQAQIFEAFGTFFVPYIIGEGYENLLCCQGSTLRDWMTNINAIHQHLQTTFPKKMIMPEFWCEENQDGSLKLFYYSARGNFLAPLAVGLVREVARFQFELDIHMELMTAQGVDGSRFTSWLVTTRDPKDLYKLCSKTGGRNGVENAPTTFKCPMSGVEVDASDIPGVVVTNNSMCPHNHGPLSVDTSPSVGDDTLPSASCPVQHRSSRQPTNRKSMLGGQMNRNSSGKSLGNTNFSSQGSAYSDLDGGETYEKGGLSAAATKKLFPYHVVLDPDFIITQVGPDLPKVLNTTESILYGYEIDDVFEFVKPKPAKWTRSWLRKLEDQEFVLECTLTSAPVDIEFKGTLVAIGPYEVMLVLCPDAKNLDELRSMNLTLSDLPAHGAYRDAVFLREHLSRQMNNALHMEKLSKTLQTEKELLESLLPVHAAEGLRQGTTVKPMLHNNVTMFFSDIVGFTNMCKSISPWQVIGMLNQLYGIMDHLAKKFHLFKVETIGDAYVCCSGLPESDEDHAVNVANFAVAVSKQCGKVRSPLDGKPIQLRIGVHTGPCASGIVGVTNPRYCVFGDTVNTTARHESTGEPGRVHCSLATMIELMQRAPEDFNLVSRGMVEMKGKGPQPTYWLESTKLNEHTGKAGMKILDAEVAKKFEDILSKSHAAHEETCKPNAPNASSHDILKSPVKTKKVQTTSEPNQDISKPTPKKCPVVSSSTLDEEDITESSTSCSSSNNSRSSSSNNSTQEGKTRTRNEEESDLGSYEVPLEDHCSSDVISACSSSATPSRKSLAQLIKRNQQRPPRRSRRRREKSRERHDANLLKAIETVEEVMTHVQ